MYERDHRLMSKWQRYGNRYPPETRDGKTYWLLKHPDLRDRLRHGLHRPAAPGTESGIGVLAGYVASPFARAFSSQLGGCLAFNVAIPLVLVGLLVFSHGILSALALLILYVVNHGASMKGRRGEEARRVQLQRTRNEWAARLPELVDGFREKAVPQLVSYSANAAGRSVPLLLPQMTAIGVCGVPEAVPEGAPYRTSNGVYSADIGVADRECCVLLDVEVDEPNHFDDFQQWCHDRHRNDLFLRNGWSVVRLSEHEVMRNPAACARDIVEILDRLRQANRTVLAEMKNPANW